MVFIVFSIQKILHKVTSGKNCDYSNFAFDFWFQITSSLLLGGSEKILYKIHLVYQKFGLFNRCTVKKHLEIS
jgi:hypothetical protein